MEWRASLLGVGLGVKTMGKMRYGWMGKAMVIDMERWSFWWW